jgi:hypothetical protein
MNPNIVAVLYLVSGVLFILALRDCQPGFQPARQPVRHDRHGHRGADHARIASAG